MNEAEIAYQASETLNRLWVIQQWWASISFGVLILSFVTGRKLSKYIILGILFLYSAYSAFMWNMLFDNSEIYTGYLHDLELLSKSGTTLSAGSKALLGDISERHGITKYLAPLVYFGTYFATVGYLLYQYVKGRNNNT